MFFRDIADEALGISFHLSIKTTVYNCVLAGQIYFYFRRPINWSLSNLWNYSSSVSKDWKSSSDILACQVRSIKKTKSFDGAHYVSVAKWKSFGSSKMYVNETEWYWPCATMEVRNRCYMLRALDQNPTHEEIHAQLLGLSHSRPDLVWN